MFLISGYSSMIHEDIRTSSGRVRRWSYTKSVYVARDAYCPGGIKSHSTREGTDLPSSLNYRAGRYHELSRNKRPDKYLTAEDQQNVGLQTD